MGDPIKVVVARVDLDQQQIDFVIAGEPVRTRGEAGKGRGKGKLSARKKADKGERRRNNGQKKRKRKK